MYVIHIKYAPRCATVRTVFSLYDRNPRVVLVDVNHKVCDTHQVCATVRNGAQRCATSAKRIEPKSPLLSIDNTPHHRLLRVTMIDINYCDERVCYQKWRKAMIQHRSYPVKQHYFQERRMDVWDREYASIEERMRRELMMIRKERLLRERTQWIEKENLAIAKSEIAAKRRRECKQQAVENAMYYIQNPRRSARLAAGK
jgi:hypothetical protein